jgi:hypothetical protein
MKRLFEVLLLCGCLAAPARALDARSSEALRTVRELAAIVTGDTIAQKSHSLTAQLWSHLEGQIDSKVDGATPNELRARIRARPCVVCSRDDAGSTCDLRRILYCTIAARFARIL